MSTELYCTAGTYLLRAQHVVVVARARAAAYTDERGEE